MENNVVQFETITDISAFRALEVEWNNLWQSSGGEYFQTFAFCLNSFEAIAKPLGRRLHCIVGRDQGRFISVSPFVTYRKLFWTFATPLGPENRTPNAILIEDRPDAAAIVAAMWRETLKSPGADVIELQRVRSDSVLHRCAMHHRRVTRSLAETTPYAKLGGASDWDAFCRSRAGRSGNRPEYLQRRLSGKGKVVVQVVDHTDIRVQQFVDWLLFHKQRWAERGGVDSSWLFSAQSRAFLVGLLTYRGSVQPFRLFVLTLNGTPIAMNLLAIRRTCVDLIMNTFDVAYAKLSPGTVLVDYCVKWAFDNGLEFDFGSGQQPYKTFWSGGVSYQTTSLQIANTRWGLVGCVAKHTVSRVLERIKTRADREKRGTLTVAPAD